MSTPQPMLGAKQAALVLLALDEELASDIMRHLSEADLRRLAEHADKLEPIPVEAIGPAFEEFEKRMREPVMPVGAGAYIRRLTASTFGNDRAQKVFAPPKTPPQPMETIRSARAGTLAELLKDEHPQMAAVIMSQLPRELAAKVLQILAPEKQGDLLSRVANLKEIPAKMVELASEALARTLASTGTVGEGAEPKDFDGVTFAAGLLNDMMPADSDRLLGTLEQSSAKLVPKIREAMFTFEDLARLPVRGLQVLMREVATEQLLIALKTASEGLREHFLSSISSRAAAAMRDDLAAMPPTRLSDVEKGQREIVEAALRLAADGRLVLPGGGSEKMV